MEKMSTLFDEMIYIMPECVVHLHGHQNKMVPFMKSSILANLSNGDQFCSCTCWLSNDIQSHCISCQVKNHHIDKEDMVLSNHVKIGS